MYLVIFPVGSSDDLHLFFWTDPRLDGCPHAVMEGVDFIDLEARSDEWQFETTEPNVVARSRRSPKTFKAFRSELDVPMGWDILAGSAEVWASWEAFARSIA